MHKYVFFSKNWTFSKKKLLTFYFCIRRYKKYFWFRPEPNLSPNQTFSNLTVARTRKKQARRITRSLSYILCVYLHLCSLSFLWPISEKKDFKSPNLLFPFPSIKRTVDESLSKKRCSLKNQCFSRFCQCRRVGVHAHFLWTAAKKCGLLFSSIVGMGLGMLCYG